MCTHETTEPAHPAGAEGSPVSYHWQCYHQRIQCKSLYGHTQETKVQAASHLQVGKNLELLAL